MIVEFGQDARWLCPLRFICIAHAREAAQEKVAISVRLPRGPTV